ncbi:hypothetical protein C8R48DRAFT_748627 [Suillus tomentosus]|nr:hypothetical protein C8R48DRAFT_748627 [Suillus tomentosus]
MNYYSKLRRITSSVFPHLVPPKAGELALFCPACPQPGVNLSMSDRNGSNPAWLYSRSLVMDGNFKAEHLRPTNPTDEVALTDGLGFMVSDARYKMHLSQAQDIVQRSDCNKHQAVNQANAFRHQLEATGIGGCACARHRCFVPHSMSAGQRQMNMNYTLYQALGYNTDGIDQALTFYDINCQYNKHLSKWIEDSPYLDLPWGMEIIPGIGLWHVHGHQDKCYVRYASNFITVEFNPETMVIPLLSNIGIERCAEWGIADLVLQEISLREGQANDALHAVRTNLADKAVLFHTTVRSAKSQAWSTRAWARVHSVGRVLNLNTQIYTKCWKQLINLGADDLLMKYRLLEKADLKTTTVVADPNAHGQRNSTLAWFWSIDVEGDSTIYFAFFMHKSQQWVC